MMENNKKNKTYLVLSIACLIFFGIWQWLVVGSVGFLDENFRYEAGLSSFDNFYDEELKKYSGEVNSVAEFAYSAKPSMQNDEVLEIRNTFNVKTLAGEDVIRLDRLYGVDRNTGKHLHGYGDRDRQGYLFAPKNLKYGEEFIYWHINYDGPAKMHFVREAKLFGLKVYEYEADYDLVSIDQTDSLRQLPEVGISRGVEVEPRLKIWVEPVTGYLIKYADDSTAYYYDLETRERIAPWNKFRNEYTEASIVQHVSEAAHLKQVDFFLSIFTPIAFLVLAVIFMLLFMFKKKQIAVGREHKNLPRDQKIFFVLFLVFFSVSVFVFASLFFKNANTEYAKAEFESRISEINDRILEQFNTRTNILRGARGLFDASEEVTKDEWKKYVDSLDILNNFVGITSIRFATYVSNEDKANHETEMRQKISESYKVWPEGEREVYAPVIFYEPKTEIGDRIFGFDLLSDKARSEAALRARDTGEITVSERVAQVFADDLPTSARILIYAPVFHKNLPHETVDQRRVASRGFVYISFQMQNFMESIYGTRNGIINIEVFDVDDEGKLSYDDLLYSNNPDYQYDVTYSAKFSRLARLDVGGRTWIIRYSSTPDFGLDFSQRFFPPLFIVSGLIIYLFILILVYELFVMKNRALRVVEEEKDEILSLTKKRP